MKKSHNFWLRAWYGESRWTYWLLPLSWLFLIISNIRKFFLIHFSQKKLSIPVIVVGNISVGGTGKTPLIIELVKYLQAQGNKPGVVSRGYGGDSVQYPFLLNGQSKASECGDEPLLIYRDTQCAVCVSPNRVEAAKCLVEAGCTHILSDDGLQHYRLGREMEIAVVDGHRLFGNQKLLPVGPLREPIKRLKSVDLIVINSPAKKGLLSGFDYVYSMNIQPLSWRNLLSQEIVSLKNISFKSQVHAVAGIGNPERFFKTLDGLSLHYYAHHFSDHYKFSQNDFDSYQDETVVMTEKDAVKCSEFAKKNWYSLIVGAQLSDTFWKAFQQKLDSLKENENY